MSARRTWACCAAFAASLVAHACSAGTQTLGYEQVAPDAAGVDAQLPDPGGDTQLPWYGGPAYHARWPNGLSASVSYVPIGVWMQSPENAERFHDVGINLFIGLWEGPTSTQLDTLPDPDVRTFCEQAGVWQERQEEPAIAGWMHGDAPDNAQELPDGSYASCIEPSVTQARYAAMTAADPSRPSLLMLGRGVADRAWVGRGDCIDRPEMYRQYAQAADVLSFGVYPLNQGLPLGVIGSGVENLLAWSNHDKPVIALVEASSIDGVVRPTPEQIRAEVWLTLVRGAAGVGYFCHRFMPSFSEIDCLEHAPTEAALGRINREVQALAPALNSPMIGNGVTATSDVPLATRLTRVSGVTFLFAVALDDVATRARFELRGLDHARVEVLGESRTLALEAGSFEDDFTGHDVHLYSIE
jgi:hypothetical protein